MSECAEVSLTYSINLSDVPVDATPSDYSKCSAYNTSIRARHRFGEFTRAHLQKTGSKQVYRRRPSPPFLRFPSSAFAIVQADI